jgi:hypothetical protein
MRRAWSALVLLVVIGCGGSEEESAAPIWYPPNVAARFLPGSSFDFIQTAAPAAEGTPEKAAADDPVVYSFALWGCNRISFGDVSKVDWTSTANQPWLAQLMADVEAMPTVDPTLGIVPPHLFYTGDMVLNEADDQGQSLKKQMEAFVPFFQTQPLWKSGANLPFLMLGNHEALISKQVQPNVYFEFLPATDINLTYWNDILRINKLFLPPVEEVKGIHKSATVTSDKVASPKEAFASYSFDMGDIHFVVLNTDTYTDNMDGDAKAIGWVQVDWLEKDLTEAEKTADLIFVFGHKPAVPFPGSGTEAQKGDLHIHDTIQAKFIEILNRHPKVAGYFAAHAHAWGVDFLETPGVDKRTMQLIAGNGGSVLQESWQPAGGTYFGPTIVKVQRSGKVTATAYGRPAPDPIYTPPTGQLTKREERQIFPAPSR